MRGTMTVGTYCSVPFDSCRRLLALPLLSMWAAPVTRLRALEPNLTVNMVTQVYLGISPIASNCQVVVV